MSVAQLQRMSWREHAQKGLAVLQELQKTLLPEHAHEVIAINVETGEYVLGGKAGEVGLEFKKRFPDQSAYIARVDGGPVTKFYDRNSI